MSPIGTIFSNPSGVLVISLIGGIGFAIALGAIVTGYRGARQV
jgi:hypothetical protein